MGASSCSDLVKNEFMGGEGYAMTFDLVQYIAQSPAVRLAMVGAEDVTTSKWMRMHPQAEEIVWLSESCWIYDHPKANTV